MPAQPTATDVRGWADELGAVGKRLASRFTRSEPRRRAVEYLRGLLSDAGARTAGSSPSISAIRPYGVQHLLGRADWDADRVRDDLIAYAHGHLADARGVLIVDETGFLKKGTKSAGVQRQYSGTAGRIENCQIGVFLAFAGLRGTRCWTASCTYPRSGPATPPAARRPTSRPRWSSPPSRSWPSGCSSGRGRPASRRPG